MKFKLYLLSVTCVVLTACGSTGPKSPTSKMGSSGVERGSTTSIIKPSTPTNTPSKKGGGYLSGDGPADQIPPDLDLIPDAVPKAEPLHPYANRPYKALGKQYTPLSELGPFRERGVASWYGKKFHGQATSSGENYDMFGMTAAHPTLPIPSYVRVTHTTNRKSVVVRVNDRGPFLRGRVIDLSYTAAHKLGLIGNGSSEVEVEAIVLNDNQGGTLLASSDSLQSTSQTTLVSNNSRVQTSALEAETVASLVTEPSGGIGQVFLQLGAFKVSSGAEAFMNRMREQLSEENKGLSLHQRDELVRVYIGPYANHQEAKQGIRRLEGILGFKPVLSLK